MRSTGTLSIHYRVLSNNGTHTQKNSDLPSFPDDTKLVGEFFKEILVFPSLLLTVQVGLLRSPLVYRMYPRLYFSRNLMFCVRDEFYREKAKQHGVTKSSDWIIGIRACSSLVFNDSGGKHTNPSPVRRLSPGSIWNFSLTSRPENFGAKLEHWSFFFVFRSPIKADSVDLCYLHNWKGEQGEPEIGVSGFENLDGKKPHWFTMFPIFASFRNWRFIITVETNGEKCILEELECEWLNGCEEWIFFPATYGVRVGLHCKLAIDRSWWMKRNVESGQGDVVLTRRMMIGDRVCTPYVYRWPSPQVRVQMHMGRVSKSTESLFEIALWSIIQSLFTQ